MKNKKIFWNKWHPIIIILGLIIILGGIYYSYDNMIVDKGTKPSFYNSFKDDINSLNTLLFFVVLYLIVTYISWLYYKDKPLDGRRR